MARRKRRNHNAKFKAKVAVEAIKGTRTIAQVADEFSLHSNQVTTWKKLLLEGSASLFESTKKDADPEPSEDVEALKAKVGELTMELDWLKKKSRSWLP